MRFPGRTLSGLSALSRLPFGLIRPGFSNLTICSTSNPGLQSGWLVVIPLDASLPDAGVLFLYPAARPWHKILKLCYRHRWTRLLELHTSQEQSSSRTWQIAYVL